jgi:hypothetical protein
MIVNHDVKITANGNGNGSIKIPLRQLLGLLGPLGVAIGFAVSLSGSITEVKGSVERIEESLNELRAGRQELINTVEADIRDGVKREVRLNTVEQRVDACCPLARHR